MYSRRKFTSAGFTMIELAVVAGVVAVLIAVLLPAVQKARESFNRAQCVNNLKQMGIALQSYAMTFGAKFPVGNRVRNADWASDYSSPGSGPQDQSGWYVYLMPFLGRDDYWSLIGPYLAPDDTNVVDPGGVGGAGSGSGSLGVGNGPGTTYKFLTGSNAGPVLSYPFSGKAIYSIYDIPWDHRFVTGRAPSLMGNPADGSQSSFWEFIQPPSIFSCPSAPDGFNPWHQMDMHPAICYSACMGTTAQNGGAQCGGYQAQATFWANLPGLPGATNTLSNGGWGGAFVTSESSIPGVFARGGYGTSLIANNFCCRIPDDIPDGISNTIALGETLPTQNTAWTEWRWLSGGYMTPATTLVPMNTHTEIFVMYNPCTPTWGGYYGTSASQQYCEGFDSSLSSNPPPVGQLGLGLCAPVPPGKQAHTSYDYLYGGGFKSNHPGGANFCFADGSVHFLSDQINMTLYQYLGCRNDGKGAVPPN